MLPPAGECLLRFVGDRLCFELKAEDFASSLSEADRPSAFLRTTIGRASALDRQVITAIESKQPLSDIVWRDIPMRWERDRWKLCLTLTEAGYFEAKPFFVDEKGWQRWPSGPNIGLTVHPDEYRSGNTIYCAFTRMFGKTKTMRQSGNIALQEQMSELDKQGFAVIPSSGKFRDLIKEIPHIFQNLRCGILHLLPINPTPTTYARFGRFGSPYAAEDLMAVDLALVDFDKKATGLEQFDELTRAVHAAGGKIFLDLVINHTGWGSVLQEEHPDWFLRHPDRQFVSPGAWGTTWEDLVEINHHTPVSWPYLAQVFLTWCRRGVDGFRCDAGYKVPKAAWQYITSVVRREFPGIIFLLEGLGGPWEATEALLREGGMQWAYSELFQNFSGTQVAGYLEHSFHQSNRTGLLVHYSETHDNSRLAAQGKAWSLMRNQLCALASVNGGYGFTCGVEWLATEKILVHGSSGMAWGNSDNIVAELGQLNALLQEHPCFFEGATLRRLSPFDSTVFALTRISPDEQDKLLILVNLDASQPQIAEIPMIEYASLGKPKFDLLAGKEIPLVGEPKEKFTLELPPASVVCLAGSRMPLGMSGSVYKPLRMLASWGIQALSCEMNPENIGSYNFKELAEFITRDPARFLAAASSAAPTKDSGDLLSNLQTAAGGFPCVIRWRPQDQRRVTMVPPDHWLLIEAPYGFRVRLEGRDFERTIRSIPCGKNHIAQFPRNVLGKLDASERARLCLQPLSQAPDLVAELLYLTEEPKGFHLTEKTVEAGLPPGLIPESVRASTILLTNSRGGMAKIPVDLSSVQSKYDCVLGANLHDSVPVDRHVFVKRVRVWANINEFIHPLNAQNLVHVSPGPPARWVFKAPAGDGRSLPVTIVADMLDHKNATVLQFTAELMKGFADRVRLILRVDIEDRNFHMETKCNPWAEAHFLGGTTVLEGKPGFVFAPDKSRSLTALASKGTFYQGVEWSHNIPHPVEASRGQEAAGDAFSAGWFDLPLEPGAPETLLLTAEKEPILREEIANFIEHREFLSSMACQKAGVVAETSFGRQLGIAAQAFLVKRDLFQTVIAGYPWFLDWGRDSLICARGLLAAGLVDEVRRLLIVFARFEEKGTLPNTIFGEDASNRETSDAPLWFGIVCEDLAAVSGPEVYRQVVDGAGRSLADCLLSIGNNYRDGVSNGICMDPESALIYSPSHYTWMDTNFPAGTPREGYPVEIQALWIRLARQLFQLTKNQDWKRIADRAEKSVLERYWLEEKGWFADLLKAGRGFSAAQAAVDDSLRPNFLFLITMGLVKGERAQRSVLNALQYLAIPGALRSLAPLPVTIPLPIYSHNGFLLNHPPEPYWGRYEGDEDTRRKPAYHNGTAWTWTFPVLCEALSDAWPDDKPSQRAARAYLGSMELFFNKGCLGQIPEIVDGDAPHTFRGCSAQAWGVTEALRVWKKLSAPG